MTCQIIPHPRPAAPIPAAVMALCAAPPAPPLIELGTKVVLLRGGRETSGVIEYAGHFWGRPRYAVRICEGPDRGLSVVASPEQLSRPTPA